MEEFKPNERRPMSGAAALAVIGVALVVLFSCSRKSDNAPQRQVLPQQTANARPAESTRIPPPTYSNLAAAVEAFKPQMTDEVNNLSEGAKSLALWGASRMAWREVKALPASRRARVMKDAASERGRVICLSGHIIEIEVHHTAAGDITVGGMADYEGAIYRFSNVGSSGDLVERSQAAMCGVVIGKISYSNSMGGVEHGVQLVGMFDLPENKPAVAKL